MHVFMSHIDGLRRAALRAVFLREVRKAEAERAAGRARRFGSVEALFDEFLA
jgi:hypothetical protein